MKHFRILLIITALLSVGINVQAKKYVLKYNLEAGNKFSFEHTLKQDITQDVMGQSQVITNTTTMKYLFEVIELDGDGNFLIGVHIGAIKFKMDNDFINMDYDSERDEEAPDGLESLAAILKVPIKILLSSEGEIMEMRDTEKYLEMVNKAMGGEENMATQMVSGATSQMTSEEGLKNQMGSFFFKYPDKKLKIGESWMNESESMQMVEFKAITENTLVEANEEKAVIKQAVKFEQMELAEGMEMEGMTMNYDLSGRREAGNQLDINTGLISNVDAITEISGVISIESPQLPTPMSIPMTIKITETIEQVK